MNAPSPKHGPGHVGVRLLLLLGTWAIALPAGWSLFANQAWFAAHDLELGAVAAALWLVVMPLPAAFMSLDTPPVDDRDAARQCARLSLFTLGFSPVVFGAMTLSTRLVDNTIVALFLGSFCALALILGTESLLGALRERASLAQIALRVGKGVGIAALIVGALALVLALQQLRDRKSTKTVTVVTNPEALDEFLEQRDLPVDVQRVQGDDGRERIELAADGKSFEQTSGRLMVAALETVDELRKDPNASGEMWLWIPARFDTVEHRQDAQEQLDVVNQALGDETTASGRPVFVSIHFGAPTGRQRMAQHPADVDW